MTIILGIDPGSRTTGYGVIRLEGYKQFYVASGCVRLKDEALPKRLQQIFSSITQIIQQYHPDEAAIENVFVSHNASSALKLGQARGAAIVALAHQGLTLAEYAARQIKQAVVGFGAADKTQVQHMVKSLLQLSGVPQPDAADALAVAICHAHHRQSIKMTQLLTAGEKV